MLFILFQSHFLVCAATPSTSRELSEQIYSALLGDANFRSVDKELNNIYAKVRSGLEKDRFEAVRSSQTEWIKKRDAIISSAPQAQRIEVASLLTRQRIRELENLLNPFDSVPAPAESKPLPRSQNSIVKTTRSGPEFSTTQETASAPLVEEADRLNREAVQLNIAKDYAKAEPLFARALEIREKVLGPDHPDTARSLNNLAAVYYYTKEYAKAEPLFVRALDIKEKVLGPDHPDTTASIGYLATLYHDTGAYAKAEPLLVRALAITEKAKGPDHPDTASSLNSLGLVYYYTEEYAKVEPLLVRALEIREKVLGPNHLDTAILLINLAKLYQVTLAYAKAEPFFVRALEIREKVLGPSHPNTASSLNNLAELYFSTADYAKAEPLYVRALEIHEKVLGPSHPSTATSLYNLAVLSRWLGEPVKARSFAARWTTVKHQNLQDVLQLDENRRLAWQAPNLKFNLVTLLKPEQIALWVMRWKCAVLDSIVEDQAAANRVDKARASKVMGELRELRQSLAATSQRGKDAEPERAALSQQISALERSLAGNSVALGRVRASADQVLDQAATSLPKDAVSVDFFRFTPVSKGEAKAHYGAVILNSAGDVAWADLGEDQVINNAVASFRTALNSSNATAFEAAWKSLYEILWKPVQKVIPDGTKGLFICPDGDLNFVPFAALSDAEGKFLSERYAIAFIGSVRDLFREPLKATGEKTMAIFANPAFSNKGSGAKMEQLAANRAISMRAMGNISLSQLAGAELEGRNVSKIAKDAGWKSALLTGSEATEPALMKLHSPGVLHLATHGFFLDGKSENAWPGVEKERGLSAKPVQPELGNSKESPVPLAVLEEEILGPMRRSGLALAGAQNTFHAWGRGEAPQPNNDGVLTAEEAAGLDLQGTWLVTLSACETGVGKSQSGEGVFGLRRAIMMAGAKNLLMTLWPVSDDTTGKIMSEFYTKALSSGKAWESLTEVQRDWLVKLRKEKGLQTAIRDAGPFAMAVMVNPANAGLDGK